MNSVTSAQWMGYFYDPVRRMLDSGKVAPETEEERIIKKLEHEREIVQRVYNSRGKIIERNYLGRYLDVTA